MKTYHVRGYSKATGKKVTITVQASSSKHARKLAYEWLTYPEVLD